MSIAHDVSRRHSVRAIVVEGTCNVYSHVGRVVVENLIKGPAPPGQVLNTWVQITRPTGEHRLGLPAQDLRIFAVDYERKKE